MCGTRSTFAQPQPKWYVGGQQVGERDLATVTGEQFRKIFPSEARGFSKEFSKVIPIADGRLYMIAFVNGNARPITRLVLYTESKTPSKCGARCRNARGKSCDCSCKGQNHGVGASFAKPKLDVAQIASIAKSYGTKARQRGVRRIADDDQYRRWIANYTKSLGLDYMNPTLARARSVADKAWSDGWDEDSWDELTNGPKFRVGDKVFTTHSGRRVVGKVVRVNRLAKPEPEYIIDFTIDPKGGLPTGRSQLNISQSSLTAMARSSNMKNTKKELMGSNDPYMGERTIKTRKGTHTDLVAEIGQNGGGGDFWAGLFLKHSDGETQVLQMKYGYKTAENAKRTAIRLFDAHVGRGGYSRSGGKAKFSNGEKNRRLLQVLAESDRYIANKVVSNIKANYGINDSQVYAELFSDDAEHLLDYVTEPVRSAAAVILKRRGYMSRSGGKAAFSDLFKVQIFHGGTLTGTLPAHLFMEYARKFVPNVSRASFLPDVISKFNEAAERANMNTRAELQVTKASRSGGKAAFGVAERVMRDGTVHLDFAEFKQYISGKDENALRYMMKDASAALRANPQGSKANYYADVVNEVGNELRKRGVRMSRKNRWSRADGNYFVLRSYANGVLVGERSFDTMQEAEFYGKRALQHLLSTANGKRVHVDIDEVRDYGGSNVTKKTLSSRAGRKAAFANWEVTPTKKHGQPIEEHTAKIGGKYFKIDTMPHLGADFGSLYVWDDLRGLKPVASGRIAALKRQAERLGTTNDALSSIILGDFSRAGRKAKMGRTGYEGIPTDTLLGEVDRLARGFYYAKNYATTHNAVASARYRVDMLNEELEKRGISTPKLKRILDSSSYSRTGAKAKFATAGQVADMFKTLSDVERASIKGDTAKMQSLLRSLAPMVDRDRAELPKDAVAYYDEMRRKAGMSRSGGKAAFSDDSEFVLMLGDGWYYTGRNRQHVRSVSKDVVRFPTRQEAEAVAKSMGNRRHTVVDVPKRGAWANIPIQDLLKHDSSRTGEKAAFASANPIANKVAQLMSEGATRDQAVAFAADARKRGEL